MKASISFVRDPIISEMVAVDELVVDEISTICNLVYSKMSFPPLALFQKKQSYSLSPFKVVHYDWSHLRPQRSLNAKRSSDSIISARKHGYAEEFITVDRSEKFQSPVLPFSLFPLDTPHYLLSFS